MPITSRLAATENALLHLLEARTAISGNPLSGLTIGLGWPGDELAAEALWIGEESEARQEWRITGSGSQAKAEVGTLEVWVWVVTPGNTYRQSRDRGLDMVGEVEKVLRDDWRLEGEVFDASVVRIRKTAAPTGEARGLFLQAFIEWEAWLS